MPVDDPLIACPVCKSRHGALENLPNNDVFAATCQNCGHFFKFKTVTPYKVSASFTVNGKHVTVGSQYSPSINLADYLRQSRLSVGTKVFCNQGGCGVCIVLAKIPQGQGKTAVSAINSCLCPLYVCDGWEIYTIEGLGSTKTKMHVLQSTLADFGGTQCGYCSPGHIMNMYGLLQKYPDVTKQKVEDNFEGHICRCTGYRPILDAMKSLVPAQTPDIEDVDSKICKSTGLSCSLNSSCDKKCSSTDNSQFLHMVFADAVWYKPTTLANLQQLLTQTAAQKVRLLGANTGTGYFYQESIDNYDVIIDISGVPELHVNTHDDPSKTFTIGCCCTLSDLMDIFTFQAAKPTDNGCFNELKKYLYRIASFPIRNAASWAGNLMLKHKYPSFPSDILNIMTVLGATLKIGQNPQDLVSVDTFLTTDMRGKCLMQATFSDFQPDDVVVCFKVMPRAQDSLALVSGAIRCRISKLQGYMVMSQPIIALAGISDTFHRAAKTEAYLYGKQLSSPSAIIGAIAILAQEVTPTDRLGLPSADYRRTVACALLYKFVLRVLGDDCIMPYRSGSGVLHDLRPLSSGIQSYDTNRQEWPLNQPLKKLEANIQCTGEAVYTDDLPSAPGQLYAAFIRSTQANATIQSIDSSEAMKLSGVVKVLTSFDIPQGATNDVTAPASLSAELLPEELFCSGHVMYYGQSIGLVIAESKEIATKATRLIRVTYNSVTIPILKLTDAIAAKAFFKKPIPDIVVGNPDHAIDTAPHVLTGSFELGEQMHFHLETQATNCMPTEDGLEIVTTTQWTNSIQQAVSAVTGIQKNKINVTVKRLGGGFGGKITRNNIVAAACGLAAKLTNRPVRMRLNMQTNFEMLGHRFPHFATYRVGFDNNGIILGIDIKMYEGQGYIPNDDSASALVEFIDNAYFCPNWRISVDAVRTNTPMNTACRAPGSVPAIFIMENLIEHVAGFLGTDPIVIKSRNIYQEGQVTPTGMTLKYCNISEVLNQLMTSAQVQTRQQILDFFNKNNRWKKKALAVVPLKFGLSWVYGLYSVLVSVHGKDGSVSVQHGGVEMGQGINTKVAQICAFQLGIPVEMVTVYQPNSINNANNLTTGGSVTSEQCCQGAIQCCMAISARMAPIKAKMVNPTWVQLVNKCIEANVVLSETYTFAGPVPTPDTHNMFVYNAYGATCAEVELDVLTGEYQVTRVDIVYDCGESLNPAVDVGQIEGAFVMGLGYCTTETVGYDPSTGKLIHNDIWGYHPPTNKDIPIDFRISLLRNAPNPLGVLRSKASGEPPQCMSCSVFFALKKCIQAARSDVGHVEDFDFMPPATVEAVQKACLVATSQFIISTV